MLFFVVTNGDFKMEMKHKKIINKFQQSHEILGFKWFGLNNNIHSLPDLKGIHYSNMEYKRA